MRSADPKLVAKLKKYTKDQIIDALTNQINADYNIGRLLNHLEEKEGDKLLEEHKEAIGAEQKARHIYALFLREMAAKYGDGKSFRIMKLSRAEYERGISLEKAIKEAEARERMLDKKVTKMLNLEE